MGEIDLNSEIVLNHSDSPGGMVHEHWPDDSCSVEDLLPLAEFRCSVDRSTGLRSDQTIRLTGPKSSRRYHDPLRRIHYFDAEQDLLLIFLTINFQLTALTHRS
jgi:hypothetical protein